MTEALRKQIEELLPVGERTAGSDFSIHGNLRQLSDLRFLGFFDSRGKKNPQDDHEYWAGDLAQDLRDEKIPFLIVTRSHASTTFFTLVNFLKNLQVFVKTPIDELWTNMGFVDLTPKKKDVIDDLVLQVQHFLPEFPARHRYLGEYTLSSNESASLLSLELGGTENRIAEELAHFARRILFIQTHEIAPNVVFPRPRPDAFYEQLRVSNHFINQVARALPAGRGEVLMPPFIKQDALQTLFDGVHLTKAAHAELTSVLRKKRKTQK